MWLCFPVAGSTFITVTCCFTWVHYAFARDGHLYLTWSTYNIHSNESGPSRFCCTSTSHKVQNLISNLILIISRAAEVKWDLSPLYPLGILTHALANLNTRHVISVSRHSGLLISSCSESLQSLRKLRRRHSDLKDSMSNPKLNLISITLTRNKKYYWNQQGLSMARTYQRSKVQT